MINEIKSSWRYRRTLSFLRLVCKLYGVDLMKTNIWREIHTAYNPLIGLDVAEDFFENAYLRYPLGTDRNCRLFFYMHRMGDIEPATYIDKFCKFSGRGQKQLLRALGMDSHMGMIFFTVGHWKNNTLEQNFEYRGK